MSILLVYAKVFGALKNLRFKETESRRALEAVRARVGLDSTADVVLRAALEELDAKRAGDRSGDGPASEASASAVGVYAKVLSGLKNMSFHASEVRRALEVVRSRVGPDPDFETLLRAALAELTPERKSRG